MGSSSRILSGLVLAAAGLVQADDDDGCDYFARFDLPRGYEVADLAKRNANSEKNKESSLVYSQAFKPAPDAKTVSFDFELFRVSDVHEERSTLTVDLRLKAVRALFKILVKLFTFRTLVSWNDSRVLNVTGNIKSCDQMTISPEVFSKMWRPRPYFFLVKSVSFKRMLDKKATKAFLQEGQVS